MTAAACPACRGEWPPAETFIADCGPANAYLNTDQFFPGWTVLVLKRHATELWELERDERVALMEGVTDVARALAGIYDAVKMNYELLGNQLAHIHWHLVPRRADDPIPRQPVWMHAHEPRALAPAEQRARIDAIRARLGK
ncbi:MAG TPA: HIT family protein [Methylomirabilota bacterium]|nr:HIT family protein [Methylomirabilota bacterium]